MSLQKLAGLACLGIVAACGGRFEPDQHWAHRMENAFTPGMTVAEAEATATQLGLTLVDQPDALKYLPRRAVKTREGTWRRAFVEQDYNFCKRVREVYLRFDPPEVLAETIPNRAPDCV